MPYVQTATTVDRTGQLEVQKLLHINTNTFRVDEHGKSISTQRTVFLSPELKQKKTKKSCYLESEGLSLWHLWKPTVSHRAIPDFPP